MNDESKVAKAIAIRKYISYIKRRVKYIKFGLLECSDNQISYFNALSESIDSFAKNHKLFMKYIVGKISFEETKSILGLNDRQTFKYLEKQREIFINYIQRKETEYLSKIPVWG